MRGGFGGEGGREGKGERYFAFELDFFFILGDISSEVR